MALKDILVAFDGSDAADGALTAGLDLAGRHGAHLTGCFPYSPPAVLEGTQGWLSRTMSDEFERIARRIEDEARQGVAHRFRQRSGGESALLHWLELRGPADKVITKAARHFDLTIIAAPGGAEAPIHADIVALRSGRPVLVVPGAAASRPVTARHLLIAWDGKRAAARSLGEAIQLLGTPGRATLLRVGDADEAADRWLDRLRLHLERHGVTASVEVRATGRSVAQTILDTAGSTGADLLVMGAYEHSKFSEDILGGTTHDVLARTPLPVFMAH